MTTTRRRKAHDPVRVLEEIAYDAAQPAYVRIQACKTLLQLALPAKDDAVGMSALSAKAIELLRRPN